MRGKTCLVTGSTSGIGRVTALELAKMGATVVMVARDAARGEAAVREIKAASENPLVHLLLADLTSLRQVRRLAEEFKGRHGHLHVLINNAGVIFPLDTTTEEGLETTYAVNHLAPFLLTNSLLDVLKASAPARIVNLASVAHHGSIDLAGWQAKRMPRGPFPNWQAYRQSKLANILFTYELARRLDGAGVTANCIHPGMVATNAGRDTRGPVALLFNRYRPWVVGFLLRLPGTFLLTPEEGAEGPIFLATSPAVEGVTGKYFVKTREARSFRKSHDRSLAQRLWQVDAALVEQVLAGTASS